VADDRDDVVGRLGKRDGRGLLVDGEVPGLAGLVPADVGGEDDLVVAEPAWRPSRPERARSGVGIAVTGFMG
jgi:hypothetical protein